MRHRRLLRALLAAAVLAAAFVSQARCQEAAQSSSAIDSDDEAWQGRMGAAMPEHTLGAVGTGARPDIGAAPADGDAALEYAAAAVLAQPGETQKESHAAGQQEAQQEQPREQQQQQQQEEGAARQAEPPLQLEAAAPPADTVQVDAAPAVVLDAAATDPVAAKLAAAAAEAERRAAEERRREEEAARRQRQQDAEAELTQAEDWVGFAEDEGQVDVQRGLAALEALFARLEALIDSGLGESATTRQQMPPALATPPAAASANGSSADGSAAPAEPAAEGADAIDAARAEQPAGGELEQPAADAPHAAGQQAEALQKQGGADVQQASEPAAQQPAAEQQQQEQPDQAEAAQQGDPVAPHASEPQQPATEEEQQLAEQQPATEEQQAQQAQPAPPSVLGLDPAEYPELAPLADAAYTLACLLSSGLASAHGLPANDSRAAYVLHRSALAGSLEAKLALADRYLTGRGVPRLVEEGLRYAKAVGPEMLAQLDEAGAIASSDGAFLRLQFMDASYTPSGAAWEDANTLSFEQDLAARGDAEAHRQLGYRMLTGQGMARDLPGAYREFQAAAQGGDPYAQFNMGFMHIRGMVGNGSVNYTAAHQHFSEAAAKELPAALNGLGVLHFHGQGVAVNYSQAVAYFAAAADRDHDAAFNLATMYQGGYGVDRNMSTALAWYRNSTLLGSWRAPHQLFLVLADGLFEAERDAGQAADYFWRFMGLTAAWRDGAREAADRHAEGDAWGAALRYALLAEQGSAQAMLNLAWLLHRGGPCMPPPGDRASLALPLWLRAAGQKQGEGMLLAGHAYRDGDRLGVPGGELAHGRASRCVWHLACESRTNLTRAVELYEQAASVGSVEALFTLGRLRERGLGLPRNTSEAARLYRQAIDAAPHEAFAMPPFLALHWLRVRLLLAPLLRPLLRLLGGLRALLGGGFVANGAAAGRAGAHHQQQQQHGQFQARSPALPAWDTLVIAALVGVLTWVLWRKRQLQQQPGDGEQQQGGAGEPHSAPSLQQQQQQQQQPSAPLRRRNPAQDAS